jgi:sulfate transport system ATP-binding protein
MSILVQDITKQFGDFLAVDNVSLKVESDSLVALLGPSGSGKSTLLRIMAGLEAPDRGQVWIENEDATYRSVQERQIGFVFQHYALFKHLTVRNNIAFGLNIRKASKSLVKQKVDELLDLIQLRGLGDRYPSQLSGGQRQRVALARSLAAQPKTLLLDEPFGALDAKVRKELRTWLRQLHEQVHVTTIFVTHDQEEAMEVADQVVIMNNGRIEQIGTPAEVYDNPATPFVMSFIGPVNVLPANRDRISEFSKIHSASEDVYIRPRDILIETEATSTSVSARITRLIHLGWEVQAELMLGDGQVLTAHLTRERFDELKLQPQQYVHIEPKDAKSFPLDYSI